MKYCSGITKVIIIFEVHCLLLKNKFVISSQLDLGSEVGFRKQKEKDTLGQGREVLQQYLKHFYSHIIVAFGKKKIANRHFPAAIIPA